MSIITFKGIGNKETGNTSTAIAVSTYMSIKHNMKILLVSTGFNEEAIKESFWTTNKSKFSLLQGKNNKITNIQSGIEGLSRMISSSKIEPRIIRDYTKVVLTGRFDILLGVYGNDEKQYKEVQQNYVQVINTANKYYDMVLVDLDRRLLPSVQEDILAISDVTVLTVSQKMKDIQNISEVIEKNNLGKKDNCLIAIGKYDGNLKYNLKNLTRNVFKNKRKLNSIPYNGNFYESMQEGTIVDLILNLLKLSNKKDDNFIFVQEIQRLSEDIIHKKEEMQIISRQYK